MDLLAMLHGPLVVPRSHFEDHWFRQSVSQAWSLKMSARCCEKLSKVSQKCRAVLDVHLAHARTSVLQAVSIETCTHPSTKVYKQLGGKQLGGNGRYH